MRRLVSVALALVLALALAACGDDAASPGEGGTSTDEQAAAEDDSAAQQPTEEQDVTAIEGDAGVTVTGEPGSKPSIAIPGRQPPGQLHYVDLAVGDGEEAPQGAHVVMHYVGVGWSDGEQFDASWDSGQPLDYPLSQLIPGWQQGVPGMRAGGRRLLVIPPALGYGAQGYPPVIAPNETLVFVIDLLEVK